MSRWLQVSYRRIGHRLRGVAEPRRDPRPQADPVVVGGTPNHGQDTQSRQAQDHGDASAVDVGPEWT